MADTTASGLPEQEQLKQAVLHAMNQFGVGVLLKDLDTGRYLHANQVAQQRLGYSEDEEPFGDAEAPAAPEVAYDHDVSFELPTHEGDPLAEIYAATAVTHAEMDAIAALYRGLNDSHRTRHDEPDAAQDEEMG